MNNIYILLVCLFVKCYNYVFLNEYFLYAIYYVFFYMNISFMLYTTCFSYKYFLYAIYYVFLYEYFLYAIYYVFFI